MENYEYFAEGYKRVWNNFRFSFKMYSANIVFQRRLCLEALEEIERLQKDYLMYYQVSTFGLFRHYSKLIQGTYNQIR